MFSTSVGYHEYLEGGGGEGGENHNACGGYHEYIGGCSIHWMDTMIHVGNIMSVSGVSVYKSKAFMYLIPT